MRAWWLAVFHTIRGRIAFDELGVAPIPVVELNSGGTDEHPHVTADGLGIYYTATR